jgi:hypothetical protein
MILIMNDVFDAFPPPEGMNKELGDVFIATLQ